MTGVKDAFAKAFFGCFFGIVIAVSHGEFIEEDFIHRFHVSP
jgi:hypothetical protein